MPNTDNAKGTAKEKIGELTGDDDMKNEGKVDQAKGKVKDGVDKIGDKLTGKD